MTNQLLLNQKYEIDGLFNLPWGECYGKLSLNPNSLHLEILKKLPAQYDQNQFFLNRNFVIRGESYSYGKILILDPIVIKVASSDSFVDKEKLVKINIAFMTVLSGEVDYSDLPLFKTVRLVIDGTKEWLRKSDQEVSDAYDKADNTATEVFNVKVDKNLTVKNGYTKTSTVNFLSFEKKEIEAYIQFDFEEKKSIDEIKEISYQWSILQSLLSSLYTKNTKITLHNEKIFQIVGEGQIKGEDTAFLYYSQRDDKDFDEEISNITTWHQKYLGDINYDEVITNWFSRTAAKKSISNLFYSAVLQAVFTPDKFLNMARALEGYSDSKIFKYIKDEDIKSFKEDDELQKVLNKYVNKPKNFLKKISIEKNSLQDRIELLANDLPRNLLGMICWENIDASRIVKLRNDCSHSGAGGVGGINYVKDSTELFYKMMFILIYIQLNELGFSDAKIINFIANNQQYSPIISDYLQRPKSLNTNISN